VKPLNCDTELPKTTVISGMMMPAPIDATIETMLRITLSLSAYRKIR
jgi:hypothetical protein